MKPEELLVLITILFGAAVWTAGTATAQMPADIMPDIALELHSAWEAITDRFCGGPASPHAGTGFDAAMLR